MASSIAPSLGAPPGQHPPRWVHFRPLPSPVAQLAEHSAVNRRVVGSSPTRGAFQPRGGGDPALWRGGGEWGRGCPFAAPVRGMAAGRVRQTQRTSQGRRRRGRRWAEPDQRSLADRSDYMGRESYALVNAACRATPCRVSDSHSRGHGRVRADYDHARRPRYVLPDHERLPDRRRDRDDARGRRRHLGVSRRMR